MRQDTKRAIGWTAGLFVALAAVAAIAYFTGELDPAALSG